MTLMIQVVNPEIKRERRGTAPRDLTWADIITVPVTYQRGTYPLMDMLSNSSIRNVISVYNKLNEPEKRRKAALKAPHKA